MRFLSLHAKNFGPLVERNFELQADIFVVFGPNEAGKSSFHAALQSILYGFEKAKRQDHPLAQFGEAPSDLELGATLRLDDGRELQVERALLSYSKLSVKEGPENEVYSATRNEALPMISSIPKALFDAVYSLTANDTSMQTDDVHEHIQELLLGETGLRGARPIGAVRRTLLEDMQGLWRSDRMGKPKSGVLKKDIKAARSILQQAKKDDRELRDKVVEREQLGLEETELRSQIDELTQLHRRLEYLQEWRELRAKKRDNDAVEARVRELPAELLKNTVRDPQELESRQRKIQGQMQPQLARLEQPPKQASERQTLLQSRQTDLESLFKEMPDRRILAREAENLNEDLQDKKSGLGRTLAELGVQTKFTENLRKAPLAQVQVHAEKWGQDLEEHRALMQAKRPSNLWMLMAGLGILCALGSVLLPAYAWYAFGGCLLFFALGFWSFLRPTQDPDLGAAPHMPDEASAVLQSVGLTPSSFDSPLALTRLADEMRRAQAEWNRARDIARRLQQKQEQLQTSDAACLPLLREIDSNPAKENWASRLEAEWKRAMESGREAASDQAERKSAQAVVDLLREELQECESHLDSTQAILQAAFPDRHDTHRAFEDWKQHIRRVQDSEQDLGRLRTHPLYREEFEQPNFDLQSALAQDSELTGEQCSTRIKACTDRRDEVLRELGSIDRELQQGARTDLAQANEAVQALEAELVEVQQEHDRLALLANILEKAETKYREANQPDVLKRAGGYLSEITQGRYTQLRYPEAPLQGEARAELEVLSSGLGWRKVQRPLSRGTQEQIYLSLRLGTLDFLDQNRERLPLVLDEALVHWDAGRRGALYGMLKKLADRRQIILFTCHRSFAEEVQESMDARLIELTHKQPSGREQE